MLWDFIKEWVDRDRQKLIYRRIDPNHCDQQFDQTPLEANRHYIRLRLPEMFLKKQVAMAKSWYPAVHSLVRLDFGNQQQVEIPNIADSTRIAMQKANATGDVVVRNFPLTPAIPFSGGLVSISAALLAIQGQDYLQKFIGVLGNFSSLLAVPQLSAALSVARPLASGIQELFGAGDGQMHLGLYESVGAGELKAGYIVTIRATENDVDLDKLWIVEDQLREGTGLAAGQHQPFNRFDYMLFRVELFEERDDYRKLTYVNQPFEQALDALKDNDEKKAELLLRAALRAAMSATDLTQADQTRVVDKLKTDYRSAKAKLDLSGLVDERGFNLDLAMKAAMSVKLALDKGPPTLDDILEI